METDDGVEVKQNQRSWFPERKCFPAHIAVLTACTGSTEPKWPWVNWSPPRAHQIPVLELRCCFSPSLHHKTWILGSPGITTADPGTDLQILYSNNAGPCVRVCDASCRAWLLLQGSGIKGAGKDRREDCRREGWGSRNFLEWDATWTTSRPGVDLGRSCPVSCPPPEHPGCQASIYPQDPVQSSVWLCRE